MLHERIPVNKCINIASQSKKAFFCFWKKSGEPLWPMTFCNRIWNESSRDSTRCAKLAFQTTNIDTFFSFLAKLFYRNRSHQDLHQSGQPFQSIHDYWMTRYGAMKVPQSHYFLTVQKHGLRLKSNVFITNMQVWVTKSPHIFSNVKVTSSKNIHKFWNHFIF